jgi:hypothetical protein
MIHLEAMMNLLQMRPSEIEMGEYLWFNGNAIDIDFVFQPDFLIQLRFQLLIAHM